MIFSDFYKGPRSPLAKLRHHHPQLPTQTPSPTPGWAAAEYADLSSKDRAKQKEAIKRYLSDKVKSDWEFAWPPRTAKLPASLTAGGDTGQAETTQADLAGDAVAPRPAEVQDETRDDEGYQVDVGSELEEPPVETGSVDDDDNDDTQSIYSVVSEDAVHYRPRMEWTSDLSDDEAAVPSAPPRLDGADTTPSLAHVSAMEKRARRRRALRDEAAWNEGLACFEARRNAWTCAKTVRVRSKPATPSSLASPRSPRRFFFRHSMSASPPSPAPNAAAGSFAEGSGIVSDASSAARDASDRDLKKHCTQASSVSDAASAKLYPVETLLPVAPPLLPPINPLRASIAPPVYLSLYDKVIANNLPPNCPINLSDLLRSCVSGWKRDGEWPPKPAPPAPAPATRKKKRPPPSSDSGKPARRMSFGILSRDKDKEEESRAGRVIRRSLQRALGINNTTASPNVAAGDEASKA